MKIKDTIVRLLLEEPLYGYIAATTAFSENLNIDTIETRLTPKLFIQYNPDWLDCLDQEKQFGVLIHEFLHVVFLHPSRGKNKEKAVWVIASDMAVNEWISADRLHETAVTRQKICDYYGISLLPKQTAEYYYEVLLTMPSRVSFLSTDQEIKIVFEGHDKLIANDMMMTDDDSTELKNLKESFSSMLTMAKAETNFNAGLSEYVHEVYHNQKLNWRRMLKSFLCGRGKMVVRKSYKRQSRRYEGVPGTKRAIGVKALLAIDESGSIPDSLVKQFYNELIELNKITGATIWVTRFDTQASKPVLINEMVHKTNRVKRGGTDFRPIFEIADTMSIPLVIILTDGAGTAPETVNQKVLWLMTHNKHRPATYGHYVDYEVAL